MGIYQEMCSVLPRYQMIFYSVIQSYILVWNQLPSQCDKLLIIIIQFHTEIVEVIFSNIFISTSPFCLSMLYFRRMEGQILVLTEA